MTGKKPRREEPPKPAERPNRQNVASRNVRRAGAVALVGVAVGTAAWLADFRLGNPATAAPDTVPIQSAIEDSPATGMAGAEGMAPTADSLAALEQQASASPNDPEVALALAQAYAEKNRFRDALSQFERASRIDANLIPARVGQGQMWEKLRRPASAVTAFRWALQRLPKNAELHLEIAASYLSLRDINAAIRHLREAVTLAPENPETHRALASGYLITLTYDGALREAKRAVELSPSNSENWTILGEVYSRMSKRNQEAGDAFRKALALKPEAAVPNVLLAKLLIEAGDAAATGLEAHSLLVRALDTDPFNAEALYLLGQYYSDAGDLRRAAATLREARACDPESTRIMLLLGQVLTRAKQREEGRELIARSERLVKDQGSSDLRGLEFQAARNPDPGLHLRLATIYLAQGLYDSARYVASRAIGRKPKDEDTRQALERVVQTATQKAAAQ